jgi:hypothetical protein
MAVRVPLLVSRFEYGRRFKYDDLCECSCHSSQSRLMCCKPEKAGYASHVRLQTGQKEGHAIIWVLCYSSILE